MFSMVSQENEVRMSSLTFLHNYINPSREQSGEKALRNTELLRKIQDELDLTVADFLQSIPVTGGKPQKYVNLDYDQMMLLGMRESKHVRKAVLEKLKQLSAPKEDPIVLLAQKVLIQANEIKKLEETKAHISSKREATLMNKASQDAKKIKKLESKLQDVGNYQSLIAAGLPQRTETELNPNAQTWRVLKKLCDAMGMPPKKVKDERYGEVNTYHVSVIEKYKAEYLD